MKLGVALVCVLLSIAVYPSTSISRWFSSTYHDLRFTLRRYGHCVGDLAPFKDHHYNETEYLIHQIRLFLDQANYDNEQMANITALMDNICRSDMDNNYPISVNIDIAKYNSTTGKENRCRAIDEAMDAMFYVFKRSALNKSEPLDFSVIQFHPNPQDREATYNLTDLINTSWIKSDTPLETVCKITDSVKDYVQLHSSNSTAQDRSTQQQQAGLLRALMDFLDSLLDPILGAQKRFYWESTNRFELLSTRISNQLGNLRDGIGSRVKSTGRRITGLLSSPTNSTTRANSTLVAANSSATPVTPLSSSRVAVNSSSASSGVSTTSSPSTGASMSLNKPTTAAPTSI